MSQTDDTIDRLQSIPWEGMISYRDLTIALSPSERQLLVLTIPPEWENASNEELDARLCSHLNELVKVLLNAIVGIQLGAR